MRGWNTSNFEKMNKSKFLKNSLIVEKKPTNKLTRKQRASLENPKDPREVNFIEE